MTAVEFQTEQIGILVSKLFNDEISKAEFHFKRFEIGEQANEIFKQQIIDAYGVKVKQSIEQGTTVYTRTFGEQYYNGKFKNK